MVTAIASEAQEYPVTGNIQREVLNTHMSALEFLHFVIFIFAVYVS